MGAIVLGLVVGVVCLFFVTTVKNMFGYDDALDVFGVHCIGGIVGAIGTGILVTPALGGTGIMDYTTGKIADYDFMTQVIAQCKAVATTLVWSGVGSFIIYKVVDFTIGLRPTVETRARRPRSHRSRRARLQHVSATRDTVGADTRHRPVRREASVARPGPLSFWNDDPSGSAIFRIMTKTLEKAIAVVADMPKADQDQIGRKLLVHVRKLRKSRADLETAFDLRTP